MRREEDEHRRQQAINALDRNGYYVLVDWLKSLPLNLKKKNEDVAKLCSNEWSEKDEKILEQVIDVVYDYCPDPVAKYKLKDWLTKRLKSLRPQSQHHDTYYDIIHNILATLKDMDFMKITPEHRVSLLNDIRVKCKNADECAAILDEPRWKPSEEQMSMLLAVIRDPNNAGSESCSLAIKSLYEDLQKLI